ncbi:DCC1-like thiol-disulfide oxidoreductase family protein [Calidithermus timidus]|uniref:DCC1-like thiol-disulfide oxidoreductase family protein n=1 Tax=Calidithermus timidus TaxID=307124 RepID=UPI0012F6A450
MHLQFSTRRRLIHAQGDKYRIFRGFDAVVALTKYLPPLWPVLPIAVLLQVSGLGPKLYRWLADHRVLVTAGTCKGESCPINRGS